MAVIRKEGRTGFDEVLGRQGFGGMVADALIEAAEGMGNADDGPTEGCGLDDLDLLPAAFADWANAQPCPVILDIEVIHGSNKVDAFQMSIARGHLVPQHSPANNAQPDLRKAPGQFCPAVIQEPRNSIAVRCMAVDAHEQDRVPLRGW